MQAWQKCVFPNEAWCLLLLRLSPWGWSVGGGGTLWFPSCWEVHRPPVDILSGHKLPRSLGTQHRASTRGLTLQGPWGWVCGERFPLRAVHGDPLSLRGWLYIKACGLMEPWFWMKPGRKWYSWKRRIHHLWEGYKNSIVATDKSQLCVLCAAEKPP